MGPTARLIRVTTGGEIEPESTSLNQLSGVLRQLLHLRKKIVKFSAARLSTACYGASRAATAASLSSVHPVLPVSRSAVVPPHRVADRRSSMLTLAED